jgi:hypothetical protein
MSLFSVGNRVIYLEKYPGEVVNWGVNRHWGEIYEVRLDQAVPE